MADILDKRNARRDVKVLLFHSYTRKPLVKRHPMNQRSGSENDVQQYKQSILAHGVWGGWTLVLVQDSEDAMAVVDGGTFFEAMCAAIEEDPANPHCIKFLRDGVTNTLVLDFTTDEQEILILSAVFA